MSAGSRRIALLPLKGFSRGKSRLATALPPVARARVVRELAERALAALRTLEERGRIGQILVLSGSPQVSAWARQGGAAVLEDAGSSSLARVVDRGLAHAAALGFDEALVLMGDLWEVAPEALAALCAAPPPAAVPDHHGTGTNALLTPLPAPAATAFGRPGSLALHRAAWGPALSVLHLPELARDLDLPADLRQARAREALPEDP